MVVLVAVVVAVVVVVVVVVWRLEVHADPARNQGQRFTGLSPATMH